MSKKSTSDPDPTRAEQRAAEEREKKQKEAQISAMQADLAQQQAMIDEDELSEAAGNPDENP